MENDKEEQSYTYDEQTLSLLEKRREDYIAGSNKGLTIDESLEYIKNELKRSGL